MRSLLIKYSQRSSRKHGVTSLTRIRYNPASDTLIVRVDEFGNVARYTVVSDDIEIGVNEIGMIVEIRIHGASQHGLARIADILRRRRRRL